MCSGGEHAVRAEAREALPCDVAVEVARAQALRADCFAGGMLCLGSEPAAVRACG